MTRINAPALFCAGLALYFAQATAQKADFTVEGTSSLEPVFTESFDTGMGDWAVSLADANITWTTKDMGGDKSFSKIKPGDAASLYVDGPYQTYKRARSSVDSPLIAVPEKGVLSFYAGFTLNYNDVASLSLTLSTDGFETSETLWCSLEETGGKPWAWRPVSADLSKWSGRNVVLRFEYGPGTSDMFGTGGYLGDFAVDGLEISGWKTVDGISVMTGEEIRLMDISDCNPVSYSWSMPGAVPDSSAEANPVIHYTTDGDYGITLEVTDATGGKYTVSKSNFVHVTGMAPIAKIIPPATFLSAVTHKPLVAPLAEVQFHDGSSGFPNSRSWAFMHTDDDPDIMLYSDDSDPWVSFRYQHDKAVSLSVSNAHGASDDLCEVTAEYSSRITNTLATDAITNFDMEDWGVFPGSNNRKITAYAERFSAPSTPVVVDGAYVYFTHAQAEEVADQIANVGVHLYTSKDGLPDKKLDSMWWSVFELDLPVGGEAVGTAFPFTDAPVVTDEFFIVVDGIPELSETCRVSFGMAGFRDKGNTAYFLKEGQWIAASDYFPTGANHTSYMVFPSIHHSVMASQEESGEVAVGPESGQTDYTIFSYLGYKMPIESDAEWLRAVGEPNGLTLDDIHIQYDALPAGISSRTGHLRVTDGASDLTIAVTQTGGSAVKVLQGKTETGIFPSAFHDMLKVYGLQQGDVVEVYTLGGTLLWKGVSVGETLCISTVAFPRGPVVVRTSSAVFKGFRL